MTTTGSGDDAPTAAALGATGRVVALVLPAGGALAVILAPQLAARAWVGLARGQRSGLALWPSGALAVGSVRSQRRALGLPGALGRPGAPGARDRLGGVASGALSVCLASPRPW